jgi:hypothetical protein
LDLKTFRSILKIVCDSILSTGWGRKVELFPEGL